MDVDIRITIEDGKVVNVKTLTPPDSVVITDIGSQYSRFFDESSPYWVKDAKVNYVFLGHVEMHANNVLEHVGYILLNDVYAMLGMPKTRKGAVVGWLKSGDGDGCVDFGLYKNHAKDFVTGKTNTVLLDFNVDGLIIDKI